MQTWATKTYERTQYLNFLFTWLLKRTIKNALKSYNVIVIVWKRMGGYSHL